jgi:hypothetical protein
MAWDRDADRRETWCLLRRAAVALLLSGGGLLALAPLVRAPRYVGG